MSQNQIDNLFQTTNNLLSNQNGHRNFNFGELIIQKQNSEDFRGEDYESKPRLSAPANRLDVANFNIEVNRDSHHSKKDNYNNFLQDEVLNAIKLNSKHYIKS
jgi:hypothetical protein